MKIIKAIRGEEIIVDDEFYDELCKHRWTINSGYASRKVKHIDGTPGKMMHVYMHRVLLGLKYGERKSVDHRNGNKLDNRLENIRACSQAENCKNTRMRSTNTSGFKGVSWIESRGKWQATIAANGKSIYLGRYKTPEEAHEKYVAAAKELHGEFANFG